jgi:hypothetical protein
VSPSPVESWRAVLAEDAAFVGAAVRSAQVDKGLRQKARTVLWQAYAILEPAEVDETAGEVAAEPVQPAELLALLHALAALRTELGDAGAGIKRLQDVWIHKPHPERPLPIEAARATERTARTVVKHFTVRVAVDKKRMAWFEARCSEQDPTRVAKVRQPDEKDNREPMELLVKKGHSRFS